MELWDVKNRYESGKTKEEALEGIVQLLQVHGADAVGDDLVLLAARFAHIEGLEWLAAQGVDLDITDQYGFTPLHWLAKKNWRFYQPGESDVAACVELLLSQGIGVLTKDENEFLCCYHYAARSGNYQFVQALNGKKLDMTDGIGNTGVHIACDYSGEALDSLQHGEGMVQRATATYQKTVERLKSRGCSEEEVAQYCENNRIPTPQQAQDEYQKLVRRAEDYYQTVKAFVEGGVDPDAKNNGGKSALDIATECGAKKIAAYLAGEDIDDETALVIGGMCIHQAVEKGDMKAIALLAKRGEGLNSCDERNSNVTGMTPLGIACATLNVEAAELLLQHGADAAAKDDKGRTASYFIAAQVKDTNSSKDHIKKLLNLLCSAGYPVDAYVNDDSDTLLGYQCKYQYREVNRQIIRELLRLGADVNLSNRFGETPLMHLCKSESGEMDALQIMLLEKGADVTAKDQNGNTPLHYCAMNRIAGISRNRADLLFAFGKPDPQMANNDEKTPLAIASEANNESLVTLLLGHV